MKFCQGAGDDLKRVIQALSAGKEQIGLARVGDGEERIAMGGTYHCSDGWISRPNPSSKLRPKLAESLSFEHPNYYLGLRHPRNMKLWAWYSRRIKTDFDRICDSCLFVNSRWKKARKFFAKFRKKCFLVGSGKGVDARIPKNCIQPEYDYKRLLAKLLTVNKPILLAAGPLANILVMEYIRAGGTQSIIDLGTVLDMEMFGQPTRAYMRKQMRGRRGKLKPRGRRKAKGRRKLPKRRKVAKRKSVPPYRQPKVPKRTGNRPLGAVMYEKHRTKKARKLKAARRKK